MRKGLIFRKFLGAKRVLLDQVMKKFILSFILIISTNAVSASDKSEGLYGFRDLKVGVSGTVFEANCERKFFSGEYSCYGVKDLLFRWILPDLGFGWPTSQDKVELYQIKFIDPYLLTLDKNDFFKELGTEARWEWKFKKYKALSEDLEKKYEITWAWNDPNFPERRKEIVRKMSDKDDSIIYGLDTVYDNGQIVLRLEEHASFSPELLILYRSKEQANIWMKQTNRLPVSPVRPEPKPTDHSEF